MAETASSVHDETIQKTLDLTALVNVAQGEYVRVQERADDTDELFQNTLKLVKKPAGLDISDPGPELRSKQDRYLPESPDLRRLFLVAEAIGGYDSLNDLINAYSPGLHLSEIYSAKAKNERLTEQEARTLEEYQEHLVNSLKTAHQYLIDNRLEEFSVEEIYELHDVLILARARSRQITAILGTHLIHEIEYQVGRLSEFVAQIGHVEETVSGIFLVNSEIMFVPTNEIVHCINTIFKGVGNPYLAKHIDGVLLLAARNLLIQVASFHSYYGKHQIYKLFNATGTTVNTAAITFRIRSEIKKLFDACKKENRLMLTRVMHNTEREFEISVEAILAEAEEVAVHAVKQLIPVAAAEPVRPKRGWFKRVLDWFD